MAGIKCPACGKLDENFRSSYHMLYQFSQAVGDGVNVVSSWHRCPECNHVVNMPLNLGYANMDIVITKELAATA